MEKILKRLMWLVSITAFIIFGSMTIYKYVNVEDAKKYINILAKQNGELSYKSYDENVCLEIIKNDGEYWNSANCYIKDNTKLTIIYFWLTLGVPSTLFFLFFSLRWAFTGCALWKRTPPKQPPR